MFSTNRLLFKKGDIMIKLSDLLKTSIFESYSIISGKNNLDNKVNSASVLETPEFANYIIEYSLILTTFYPIKSNQSLFKDLLYVIAEKNSSGLVIKMNRYIYELPNDIIELANNLNIPVIILDYDANLSTLFNTIISEIQSKEFLKFGIEFQQSSLFQTITENPTTHELVKLVEQSNLMDILIYNVENTQVHYSSDQMKIYYDKYGSSTNTLIKEGEYLIYISNVEYEEKTIYRLALSIHEDKRHLLYSNNEIYKLLIVFIYQKKLENMMRQNQFLLSFVTNITTSSSSNFDLMETSKFYAWNIQFPIFLILVSIKNLQSYHDKSLPKKIRKFIVETLHIEKNDIRYVFIDDLFLFIANTSYDNTNNEDMHKIHKLVSDIGEDIEVKIAYSNPIDNAQDIPQTFSILSDTVLNSNIHMIDLDVFNENHVRLIKLLKTLDYTELEKFSYSIIGDLIRYEQRTHTPLINTLYKYIQCHFSIKKTSEELFLHPNSLRYRLSTIEKMGYKIVNSHTHFFDVYLALYIYINILSRPEN